MKAIISTVAMSLMVTGSCFGQGFFSLDNSADFTGSGGNSFADYIGSGGHAGEGSVGAYLGSDNTFATPNYDVSYLYLAGNTFANSSLTVSQFITDGASFGTTVGGYANVTGDTADGAGFFQDGTTTIPSPAADGSIYTVMLIAWYDPTGSTSYSTAVTDGYNVGNSSTLALRLAAGLDLTVADASGFSGFAVTSVPEPTTIALATLGGISLLVLRRRKSA